MSDFQQQPNQTEPQSQGQPTQPQNQPEYGQYAQPTQPTQPAAQQDPENPYWQQPTQQYGYGQQSQPAYSQYQQNQNQYGGQQPAQFQPQQPAQFQPVQLQAQQNDELTESRKRFSTVSIALTLLIAFWIGLTFLASAVVQTVLHSSYSMLMVYMINAICLYVIAMPLSLLVMRKVPELETRPWAMKAEEFLRLLVMCVPVMVLGSMIGNIFSSIISRGTATNSVSEMVESSDPWLLLIFVVIIGPIFEEWMFRDQIISRLRRYGEKTAILFSALAFALFHTNFYQFFYAFGLGLILGYVYTRTSQLRYSIIMHMCVNAFGSLLPMLLFSHVDSRVLEGSLSSSELMQWVQSVNGTAAGTWAGFACLYVFAYLMLLVMGVVFFVQHRKKWEFYTTPDELAQGTGASAAFGNVGFVILVVVTVGLTLFQMMY